MKFPAYTVHETARDRRGIYAAEEWSKIRGKGDFVALREEQSDANYEALLASPEFAAKMQLAKELCDRVDFSGWRRLEKCKIAKLCRRHAPDSGHRFLDRRHGSRHSVGISKVGFVTRHASGNQRHLRWPQMAPKRGFQGISGA